MNKKGVSTVIEVVLIILITIAAVIIVSSVIMSVIKKGIKEAESSSYMPSLEIQKAEVNESVLKIKVKRLAGEGVVDKIKIALFSADDSQVFTTTEGLRELEAKTFVFNYTIINPTKVEVYPISLKNGEEKIGNLGDKETLFALR